MKIKAYWMVYVWPANSLDDWHFAAEVLPTMWSVIKLIFKLWWDNSGDRYAIVRHVTDDDSIQRF